MKTRRHHLLAPPPPMEQWHSPPYSSPSSMWLVVVSSAVVTRHCGRPQPSLSSSASSISSSPHWPLYCSAFLLPLPPFSVAVTVSPSSSYLHRILFVCCRSSSLFVIVLSPFSSSRSSPEPAPHSSSPANVFLPSLLLLSHLFDCCVHPRRIQQTLFLLHRRITNIQSGHRRRRHHPRRHRGRRGSGVHTAGDSRRLHRRLCCRRLRSRATAGDGHPPRATAVRRVTLSFSFSVTVVRIFSSAAASPSRPRRFTSTVAPPPPLLVRKAPLLLIRKVYCCVRWTGLDVVDVVISSRIVVVVIASPPSPSRSAAFSEPLPDNGRYVACLDRSCKGGRVQEKSPKASEGDLGQLTTTPTEK